VKTLQSLIVALGLVASGSACQAAVDWTWAWTGVKATGSGTLTTGDYDAGLKDWVVTRITGTFGGIAITGIKVEWTPYRIWSSDHTTGSQVNSYGMYFNLANSSIRQIYGDAGHDYEFYTQDTGLFVATQQLSPVPEPAAWAAISFALLGVVWLVKRRLAPAQ